MQSIFAEQKLQDYLGNGSEESKSEHGCCRESNVLV